MNTSFENCTLLDTQTWFKKAVPEPKAKNFSTQFGVHLEEVAETLEACSGASHTSQVLLELAIDHLKQLGDHLKANEGSILVHDPKEFLDGWCDQIVTATGTAYMWGADIVGAMTEVNRSNFSKFVDGKPIFNENMKIMKGPDYFKPELSPYLPKPIPADF